MPAEEELLQVKVLDDNGNQQGEAMMMSSSQVDELVDQLPTGWSAEVV